LKRQLIITDVTRMQEGRVCIAGYDQNGRCVRPVLPPPGIYESNLYSKGQLIVFPFAVVMFDLQQQIVEPPHTEDWRYDPTSVSFVRKLDEKQRRETLEKTLFPDLAAIFEVPILSGPGHFVMAGQGPRSLGTIQPKQILEALYRHIESKWDYRLHFVDGNDKTYRLGVTDLSWRYYNDFQFNGGHSADEISATLTRKLRSNQVYLRVGLARHWEKYPDRCYLQLTGIYTFPDYLEGKTFADLSPNSFQ
jgi:hypothetical protein